MARSENNLNAVFTDTANAIRSKTGQSEQISPRDFADQISTIEVVPASEYKQMLIDLLQDTTVSITIPNEVTSLGLERWKNDTYLTTIDFNNVAVIPAYTCYNCSNLATAVFSTATTEIGEYAFYDCKKFEDTELPHTLTNIGQYAFYHAGSAYSKGTHTFTMIDNVGVHTTIGNNAFQYSHLSEINAYTNNIGTSAFDNCSSLTDVDIEIHGSIGYSAFHRCDYIENFRIDPSSVITSLGNSSFSTLASATPASSRNIAPFDFRNSTFTSLEPGVWTYNYYDGVVYFPSKLTTIGGTLLDSATGNWKLYFGSIPTVSTSYNLRDDTSNFTVKYFFPPELLEQAKQATNWSSHTSQMAAWIDGVPAGDTLQPYTKDTGLAITWYSDVAMTQVVTTSAGPSNVYYGEITGSVREAWYVDKILLDASVTISDGSVTYGSFIPVNTTVTITPSYTDPTKDQLYILQVNGVDYTSTGTATIQVTEDLTILVMYWDGEHLQYSPFLADNDWDTIKLASKLNEVPASWRVGDTKTFTYDGVDYTARLVDKTGKFTRVADGSTAYLSFEVTELLPDFEVYNSANNNYPMRSQLLAKINSGTIWDKVDPSLQSALEDVNVPVSQGGGSPDEKTIINWTGKLFLPREHDLFLTRISSVQNEWDAITLDQYYQDNNTNSDRRKCRKSSSLGQDSYWEMSPGNGGNGGVCRVAANGNSGQDFASYRYGVALRFAL